MREKYVEERFPRYFIFGQSADGKLVDVATTEGDVLTSVSVENAKSVIESHNKVIQFMCDLADAFDKAAPEAFKDFWCRRNE